MYSYFEKYAPINKPKRKKRRRANENDPNANKADLRYQENYGL